MTPAEKLAACKAPFPRDEVKWRVGSTTRDKAKGMALCYIDARAVFDRLDDVFGPGGWSTELRTIDHGQTRTWVCRLGVIWDAPDGPISSYEDVAEDTQVEASKGGASDAIKRAAVQVGIGRYLYAIKSPWVDLKGGKYISPEGEAACNRAYDAQIGPGAAPARKPSKTPAQKAKPSQAPKLPKYCGTAEVRALWSMSSEAPTKAVFESVVRGVLEGRGIKSSKEVPYGEMEAIRNEVKALLEEGRP